MVAIRATMPNFCQLNDEEVISYLIEHYDEIGVGDPDADLAERLLSDIQSGTVIIEKCPEAFAIVARANRKHAGKAFFIKINPAADSMYLLVASEATSRGIGSKLLVNVKQKYMEDQEMILVCAGSRRKRFFENAGFVAVGITEEGLHYMVCPPSHQSANL